MKLLIHIQLKQWPSRLEITGVANADFIPPAAACAAAVGVIAQHN